MKTWIRWLSVCAIGMIAASTSAQVEPHAFKLSVDTSFLSFNRRLIEQGDYSQTNKTTSFGPTATTFGLTLGLSLWPGPSASSRNLHRANSTSY